MHCPVCQKQSLTLIDLEENLSALSCGKCSGLWIPRVRYDAWRKRNLKDLPEIPTAIDFKSSESTAAKICAECGHLLLRYRVGHGLAFSIDYCSACGGVWLDRQEWEALKAKNLHDNLHQIVSEQWQKDRLQEQVGKSIEAAYQRILGPSYEKANEIRNWLRTQPARSQILAYLTEDHAQK